MSELMILNSLILNLLTLLGHVLSFFVWFSTFVKYSSLAFSFIVSLMRFFIFTAVWRFYLVTGTFGILHTIVLAFRHTTAASITAGRLVVLIYYPSRLIS